MKQNWEIKKLGDVCEIARGGSPRPIKEYITTDSDGINWIKIGDTDPSGKYIYHTAEKIKPSGLYKSRYVEEGDFLLSNSMSFGRPYILKTNGCIHDGWLVLKNYNRSLLIDFFYYMLLSPYIQEQFEVEAKGSTVRNLNTDIVSNVKIVVPPLAEQRRIVAILDDKFVQIDALKAAAQKNLDNAEQLWKAQMEKQFDNQKWEKKKLGEVCSKDCTLSYGIVQPGDEYPNGVPVVRPVDLTEKFIKKQNLKQVDPKISNSYKRTILKGGDLLFCVRGTTGIVSIATNELEGCNVTRGISPIRFDNSETALFMYYCFQTQHCINEIQAKTKGTALKQINIADLRNLTIPLPPIAEQERIVKELDALSAKINTLKANYRRQIECCDELRQSLLKKAFEGEL